MDALAALIIVFLAVVVGVALRMEDMGEAQQLTAERQPVVVRTYRGNQARSYAAFQRDAAAMAGAGYVPTSQNWAPGQWGAGSFIAALLLCLILIGLIVFLYMLIVKPDGTLTVIYQRSANASGGFASGASLARAG